MGIVLLVVFVAVVAGGMFAVARQPWEPETDAEQCSR